MQHRWHHLCEETSEHPRLHAQEQFTRRHAAQRGECVRRAGTQACQGMLLVQRAGAGCPALRNPNFVTKATGRLHLLCVSVCMFVCVSLQVCPCVCTRDSECVHTHILEDYTCIHSLLLSL